MNPLAYASICDVADIDSEGGVAAVVAGRAVAIFRTSDDRIYALDNFDPFARASVLARGIVGTMGTGRQTVDFVASPMYKQRFDLRTGRCLDDAAASVACYDVRVVDGVVMVGEDGTVTEGGADA